MIIVSIDEHSEFQYVNKIFSKNSIDYTARLRKFQDKSKGEQKTEKQKDRRTVWGYKSS